MDFSDDVAYSVHDLEDGIVAGLIDLAALPEDEVRERVLARARQSYLAAGEYELEEVYGTLVDDLWQARPYDGSLAHQGALKDVTSGLIGRFCTAVEQATRAGAGDMPLTRYDADLVVPTQVLLEIAVLKAISAVLVMDLPAARSRQAREREVLAEVVEHLADQPDQLEPSYRELWEQASDDGAALRVVVDQVAALTDAAAWGLHARLLPR
jgi:dGTPase